MAPEVRRFHALKEFGMKCDRCQAENPATKKFCRKCGAKLARVCNGCGAQVLPDDQFCGDCGQPLLRSGQGAPIDYSEPHSYTPRFLADKILTSRNDIEGERKVVTVLFADLADYTAMAERLDPEEVHQIMDGCFRVLMDEIHKFEGTINQFTGDGIMAIFGAPVSHEDHAQRACHAALTIQKALKTYGEKVQDDYGVPFKMRIGLNSGSVIVGSIGDDLRMDYTAIGDTTNLASRMEKLAPPGSVLLSHNTHRLVKDFFEFEALGRIQVKGKETPQELYKLVKAGDVITRIEAAAARGLTRFVGRRGELQGLQEAFAKAKSGTGRVVGIVGEAGVGKSRLKIELRHILLKHASIYLEGRCHHFGGTMAYLPILEILRSYFGIKEGDRESTVKKKMERKIRRLGGDLQVVLSPLQDLFSLDLGDDAYLKLEPRQKREKVFEAVRNLFIRESESRPVILAIEDLHWIDKTSEELLTYLIDWIANARILLLGLYRPEYRHGWGNKSYYSQISLSQLSTSHSAALVQSIFTGAQVAPELRELVLSRTAGNPLFLEEFSYSLLEHGIARKKDRQYVLSDDAHEIHVPDTIHGIIAARMDRLEDSLKRIMQVASVIGREFAFRILQTITGMRDELKSHLLDLQGLEFIYEKSLFPELEYIFKHALTQEVAYNSLLARRRKAIHRKIAEAIETLYPERLEEFYEMLAYHYSRSEDTQRALDYIQRSAEKAARNYCLWEAFRFHKEMIEIIKRESMSKQDRVRYKEVLLSLTSILLALGFPPDSLDLLQEGERLSAELRDTKSVASFNSMISLYYAITGDPESATRYAERCFKASCRIQDVEMMAQTAFDLCSSYMIKGEYRKILAVSSKSFKLLEKTGKQQETFGRLLNVYSALSAFHGYSLGVMGDFTAGMGMLEKGLQVSLDIDNLYALGLVEYFYGHLCALAGDGKRAIDHLQKAIGHFEEARVVILLPLCWNTLGWAYHLEGYRKIAQDYMEKGIRMQRDSELTHNLSECHYYLGMALCDAGDLEEAHRHATRSLAYAQKNNEEENQGLAWILLGRVLGKLDRSQSAKAAECMKKGITILVELHLKPRSAAGHLYLGELYIDLGKREQAAEELAVAEAMFQEMGMDHWLARTQTALSQLKAG
jgi:class 3 adenylate cyclase/tetratricopeptide (TPR) repeat protein